ncbi:AhpD-like protein [Aspergillus egyptiacus]|nr:AhpD-like protein [Aspergillus egyptiacus]
MTNPQNCLVPYLELQDAPPDVAAAISQLPYRRNIFHLLDWQLIVLRISAVLDAEYEWDVNVPVARIHGMPEEKLDALKRSAGRGGDGADGVKVEAEAIFTPRDRAILHLVDEQLATYTNSEKTVSRARGFLSVEELVEVYVVLGVYVLIARITKGLRIDLDGEIPGLEDHLKGVVTGN